MRNLAGALMVVLGFALLLPAVFLLRYSPFHGIWSFLLAVIVIGIGIGVIRSNPAK